ncbi:hypothetical protein Prum_099150 [Phytohabitans rumicis]|uniref:Uncharacterized protein n=1 Tax=Phytohabitans rumicis TaxID=1076125 RepID=A0A6V8LGA9_9ACTN|nr:hypothetical protein Prum_099150 [Phytohabitans rumicis]
MAWAGVATTVCPADISRTAAAVAIKDRGRMIRSLRFLPGHLLPATERSQPGIIVASASRV